MTERQADALGRKRLHLGALAGLVASCLVACSPDAVLHAPPSDYELYSAVLREISDSA